MASHRQGQQEAVQDEEYPVGHAHDRYVDAVFVDLGPGFIHRHVAKIVFQRHGHTKQKQV
ncbi:uncharacterized protein METZ01_LOCUS248083 [marine metagenome]|uniref:Uncharacterized protein n=1 Tax=marine metagenome TaxID=408172 RepID=A0A382I7L0_9ZZZZ